MMSRWSTDVPSSTFEGSERPVDRVFESHQPHSDVAQKAFACAATAEKVKDAFGNGVLT
jgi:hypothetical protein